MSMDYVTSPRVPTPLTLSVPVWIDLENNFAAIPGDGEGAVAMIHTSDIGHFVAAVLDLSQWEKRYHMMGDSLSIDDMGAEFEKHYDRKESLLEHKCTLLPAAKERLPPGVNESWFMGMIAAVGVRVIDKEMELST
ncbi:hypothetical protein COH20_001899 [Aspergillus flavus]|nr:hypothetical protein COH21_005732 [Aspergillus flavus]RAQ76228.1 hypothetical protein COH20_001899 [Aspergillus flavus]